MGAHLPGLSNAGGVPRPALVPCNRRRLANACSLGPATSPERPPDLAFRADVFLWMHDLRFADRDLVPCRCSVPDLHSRVDL